MIITVTNITITTHPYLKGGAKLRKWISRKSWAWQRQKKTFSNVKQTCQRWMSLRGLKTFFYRISQNLWDRPLKSHLTHSLTDLTQYDPLTQWPTHWQGKVVGDAIYLSPPGISSVLRELESFVTIFKLCKFFFVLKQTLVLSVRICEDLYLDLS